MKETDTEDIIELTEIVADGIDTTHESDAVLPGNFGHISTTDNDLPLSESKKKQSIQDSIVTADDSPPQNESNVSHNDVAITDAQLEKALVRVIEEKLADKIDAVLESVAKRLVAQEISRIKDRFGAME